MWPGFDCRGRRHMWVELLLVSTLLWEVFFLVIVRDSKRGTGLLGSLRKDVFGAMHVNWKWTFFPSCAVVLPKFSGKSSLYE